MLFLLISDCETIFDLYINFESNNGQAGVFLKCFKTLCTSFRPHEYSQPIFWFDHWCSCFGFMATSTWVSKHFKGRLYSRGGVINLEKTRGRALKQLKELCIVDYHTKPTRSLM